MKYIIAALLISAAPAYAEEVWYTGGAEASIRFLNEDTIRVRGLRFAPNTLCTFVARDRDYSVLDCEGVMIPMRKTSDITLVFGDEEFQKYEMPRQ